jgi:hypothetical protein
MPFQKTVNDCQNECLDRLEILRPSDPTLGQAEREAYTIADKPFLGIVCYVYIITGEGNIKHKDRIALESTWGSLLP